jgi:hypothetical protein
VSPGEAPTISTRMTLLALGEEAVTTGDNGRVERVVAGICRAKGGTHLQISLPHEPVAVGVCLTSTLMNDTRTTGPAIVGSSVMGDAPSGVSGQNCMTLRHTADRADSTMLEASFEARGYALRGESSTRSSTDPDAPGSRKTKEGHYAKDCAVRRSTP